MADGSALKPLTLPPLARTSVADQVFDALRERILSLALAPGARLSEADVAKAMGVSRQPVRDAFFRLSKLGFLVIRPQRATIVSPISKAAVMQAQFLRTALEMETMRVAAERLSEADLQALDRSMDAQRAAVEAGDHPGFHALDDDFHMQICERSGLGFAWTLIREKKAHMDRVRALTLAFSAPAALADHAVILRALRARDPEAAANALRAHLSRIVHDIERVIADRCALFDDRA